VTRNHDSLLRYAPKTYLSYVDVGKVRNVSLKGRSNYACITGLCMSRVNGVVTFSEFDYMMREIRMYWRTSSVNGPLWHVHIVALCCLLCVAARRLATRNCTACWTVFCKCCWRLLLAMKMTQPARMLIQFITSQNRKQVIFVFLSALPIAVFV